MAAKKNKEINSNDLVTIKPITDNQKVVFSTWKKEKNQFRDLLKHNIWVSDLHKNNTFFTSFRQLKTNPIGII